MRVEAELYRGRSVVWPIGAGVVAVALLGFLAIQPAVTPVTFLAIAFLLTALSFVALTRGAPERGRGDRRWIGVDSRGLSVDGELFVPRQAIVRATVKDDEDASRVVVETHGLAPSHVIRVASARLAQALADTLEAAPRITEFEALPPWAHRIRWLAIVLTTSPWILFNVLRHLPNVTILIVLGLYGLIALPMVVPQRVAVGEDGVLLKWAGQRRFVPFGLIEDVRATALGIELDLVDERSIEIRLGHRADGESAQRTAMLRHISLGIATHRSRAPAEDEDILARRTRPWASWAAAMTDLGRPETSGYRTPAIPRERLWAVLENPRADASAREGAALALHERLDEEERGRIVEVAEKSASPRLRVAIDVILATPPGESERIRIALEDPELEADLPEPGKQQKARS